MLAAGLSTVDPGHNIEKICIPKLASLFRSWKLMTENQIQIYESKVDTNPFTFI
ncbi:Hypothetical protein ADU71_2050 [Pediococcus damnosus]|nr:Hypothetical protein ADU69_1927 [Pediococcus damnosus]AMV65936.1 Hypothetical protein ADU71_2050 [Pediococcus damnosus]